MIKAILFDIDGVLLDSFQSNYEFIRELLKQNGFVLTKNAYKPLFYKPLWDVIADVTNAEETEVRRIWNSAHEANWKVKRPAMMKGAADCVEALSKNYKLGLVTSRIKKYTFEPPMDSIQDYFAAVVNFEDTKKHKPDPEPLLLAAKRLRTSPSYMLYVGDAPLDMEAAQAAGMKFILFSKKKLGRPDAIAKSFKELPKAISMLG